MSFMPPRRESAIEKEFKNWAETHGWFVAKIVSPSKRAMPDRVFIKQSRSGKFHVTVWIELKATNKEPTEQQYKRHAEMRSHGAHVFWYDNLEAAIGCLRRMDPDEI